MHSPRKLPSPETVSPRKRFPAPLTAASHADIRRIVHPAGSSPDSVIAHGRTAYAGERIAPLFCITIPSSERGSKREKRSGCGKNDLERRFFRGGQVCWSGFERGTDGIRLSGARKRTAADRRQDRMCPTGGTPQRLAEAGNGPFSGKERRTRGGPRMRRDDAVSSARLQRTGSRITGS